MGISARAQMTRETFGICMTFSYAKSGPESTAFAVGKSDLTQFPPQERKRAGQGGAEHEAVHFAARNFHALTQLQRVQGAEPGDGPQADEDGPHTGEPHPELAIWQSIGVVPAGAQM